MGCMWGQTMCGIIDLYLVSDIVFAYLFVAMRQSLLPRELPQVSEVPTDRDQPDGRHVE